MFKVVVVLPSGDIMEEFGPFETSEEASAWFDRNFYRWPELDGVIATLEPCCEPAPAIAIETDELPF